MKKAASTRKRKKPSDDVDECEDAGGGDDDHDGGGDGVGGIPGLGELGGDVGADPDPGGDDWIEGALAEVLLAAGFGLGIDEAEDKEDQDVEREAKASGEGVARKHDQRVIKSIAKAKAKDKAFARKVKDQLPADAADDEDQACNNTFPHSYFSVSLYTCVIMVVIHAQKLQQATNIPCQAINLVSKFGEQ
jgi:hypothetical protein